jgi:V/A-type H+-transporting ATPase subunit I
MGGEAECYIEVEQPGQGEEYPILLDNPKFVRPFEAITSMYSQPSINDIDPTLIMTPFYIIFFGIMVGDFAYGLIITAILGALIHKLKPGGTSGSIIWILFWGGVSTAVWGAVFGSYFGNLPQALGSWLFGEGYGVKFLGLWFDPLSDPMLMLIFSMFLGALHLFTGMGVKMYSLLRSGQIFEAIFDVGSWYILLVGLPLLFLGIFPGMYLAILGAAMIVLTNGRSAKNPITKFLSGLLSLYGATGYLGDVLSYSRLLALGMATGVIAAVVNTMATLNAPGFVSAIACIAIVAFGTAFNIAINMLGAFVHTCRLQYIEFFGKFYEGGGEQFKPFRIKTKYVRVR